MAQKSGRKHSGRFHARRLFESKEEQIIIDRADHFIDYDLVSSSSAGTHFRIRWLPPPESWWYHCPEWVVSLHFAPPSGHWCVCQRTLGGAKCSHAKPLPNSCTSSKESLRYISFSVVISSSPLALCCTWSSTTKASQCLQQ